jgi:hypothetical protein
MEKASGGRFAWVTRKADEDKDDWDMALNTYKSPGYCHLSLRDISLSAAFVERSNLVTLKSLEMFKQSCPAGAQKTSLTALIFVPFTADPSALSHECDQE